MVNSSASCLTDRFRHYWHYYSPMRPFRALAPACLLLLLSSSLPAQLRVKPIGELPDEAALRLMLRKLASTGTFMETTAHPDDEDNGLLAMMSHL